jgi:hypothetical protein
MSLGGVERALGKVRFARLIHSGARVLGGPAARAACGGNLSLTWLPRSVAGVLHRAIRETSLDVSTLDAIVAR